MAAWAGWIGAALAVLFWATSAPAWEAVGTARLLTNDAFGDRHDRWRAGGWQAGLLLAPDPVRPGPDLVELRFGTQVILPANLSSPAAEDRPMAGVLAFGVHGYWLRPPMAFQVGLDLVRTGPATGYEAVLDWLHDADQAPSDAVVDAQIDNGLHPTAQLVMSRDITLAPAVWLHPFAQLVVGAESLARIGADVLVGPAGAAALPIRDEVTGILLPATHVASHGIALSLGADAAPVAHSVFLPDNRDMERSSPRLRARAGVLWRGTHAQAFYGATWLGEEFSAQPEGQVVGSVHLNLRF